MPSHDDHESTTARATRVTSGPGRDDAPAAADGVRAPDAAVLRLQREVGNAGVAQLIQSEEDPHGLTGLLGGGGRSLDSGTRVQMESALGADFSGVRVHTGADADRSAASLGAHAYTSGNDIVFGSGAYDPGSEAGQRTLAHELTHVVQQRLGPVDGTPTESGVSVSDPSDRFERAAVASADAVVSASRGEAGPSASGPDPAGPSGASVQREGVPEEEEEVQTLQRESAPEDDEGFEEY